LVESASRLHEYANEPLELLIVEDILDFVLPSQVREMLGYLVNAISVFHQFRSVQLASIIPLKTLEHRDLAGLPISQLSNVVIDWS
jgi:hypothetical protein